MKKIFDVLRNTQTQSWSLDQIVTKISGTDHQGISGEFPFTIGDSCEGVLTLGEPGSGKTSAIARAFIMDYLKAQYGMVYIAVKPTDRDWFESLVRKAGRESDLVIFNENSGLKFDPLLYEMERNSRGGGQVNSIVETIELLDSLVNPSGSGIEDAGFWKNSKQRLTNAGCTLLFLSGEDINIENLKELVMLANESEGIINQYKDLDAVLHDITIPEKEKRIALDEMAELMERNFLIKCIMHADDNTYEMEEEHGEFKTASEYFLRQWNRIADKTRSSVIETLLGQMEQLNGRILKRCFTGGISDEIRPEKTIEGKIICVDFSSQNLGLAGKLAAGYYRITWAKEMLRRKCPPSSSTDRPVALIVDEYHASMFPEFDPSFQNTARSARVATLALTQGVNAIKMSLGNSNVEYKAKNLMSCFTTSIFASNSCSDTNKYSSEKIMETPQEKKSKSVTSGSKTENTSEEYVPQVRPIEFTKLRRGSKAHDMKVDAFVVKAGKWRDWRGGNFIRATFSQ